MNPILWSGPRQSDIFGLDNLFCASSTIFGSNQDNNFSYSKSICTRIDHNKPDCISDNYNMDSIKNWIEIYPDLKIMYYNPLFSKYLPDRYTNRVVGSNDISILEFLNSKCDVRQMASRLISVVPFQKIENIYQVKKAMPKLHEGNKYILQENHASGGYGTHIVDLNNIENIISTVNPDESFFVSPYFEKSISANIHCIVFEKCTVILPGSIQIVKEVNGKILYLGSDFIAYNTLSDDIRNLIIRQAQRLCLRLREMGYRGILGIDLLLIDGKPYLLEINARFQASTILINQALNDNGLPSMQELHLMAFDTPTCPYCNELENVDIPYSMAAYSTETWKKEFELLQNLDLNEIERIDLDGFEPTESFQNGAYLFHIIFRTNICSISPDEEIWTYENLFDIDNAFSTGIYDINPLHIKISLLNQGVRFTEQAKNYLASYGKVKNAVFSAVDLTILNDLHINCPSDVKLISLTPWVISLSKSQKLKIYYRNQEISDVALDMADVYASRYTKSGLPYQRVSFWATDRLRIHHTISCIFKKNGHGCRFCEIPKQCKTLNMKDIFEIIDFYLENANSFRHFLIGGGSESLEQEENHIAEISTYIRKKCNKPIYLMCLPPQKISTLKLWYNAGVTEISFNLELFDRVKARFYMPGKGSIPLSQYITALENATSIWGTSGNVRTIFVVGLESKQSLLNGIETVCSYGVMPILSVFRALKDTDTQDIVPPPNGWLLKLYQESESICRRYNLHLGPSCSECQNNTLSLPFHLLK